MSTTSTSSIQEQGRLVEIHHAPRQHAPVSPARRRNRRSPAVLIPRWPRSGAADAASARSNASTDGALALLDQPRTATRSPHMVAARHHILIVEDDSQVASVIRAGLELEGEADWSVQSAADGLHALEIASATPPDVVLLDVRLPDLGGAEVYRRLRASQKTRGSRILFLSAGTTFDLHRLGIEDGVLLRKPFDLRDLVSLVRALLDG